MRRTDKPGSFMCAARPERIQLRRTKGWRMPENTLKVDRATRWGNPWTPAAYRDAGYIVTDRQAAEVCVAAFRAWLTGEPHFAVTGYQHAPPPVSELAGYNLACWCRPDMPCHADVLLELANPGTIAPSSVDERTNQ